MSTVIKKYNTFNSQWEAILVGEPGPVASNSSVTNIMLSTMPPLTIKSNLSGSTDQPVDNSVASVAAVLPVTATYITQGDSNLTLSASNNSTGVGGRIVQWSNVSDRTATVPNTGLAIGDTFFLHKVSADIASISVVTDGSSSVVGTATTSTQYSTIVVRVVSLGPTVVQCVVIGGLDRYVTYIPVTGATTLNLSNYNNAAGRVVQYTAALSANFTTLSSMPVGASWVISQMSSGAAEVVAGASCTRSAEGSKFKTGGQDSRVYVEHRGSNNFVVIGGVA